MLVNVLSLQQAIELRRRFEEKDEATHEDDGGTDYLAQELAWTRALGMAGEVPPVGERVYAYSPDLWEGLRLGEAPTREYWWNGEHWCYDDAGEEDGIGWLTDVNVTCWARRY